MCGILVVVGPICEREAIRRRFSSGLSTLEHRGPDASGEHFSSRVLLGHRRLSIIDLSDAGGQPMSDPDTGNIIIFNGEVYNYIEVREELRAKGKKFVSGSDTEVLLKAYAEWGVECVSRLNGMFAFAIFDKRISQVFLARDRFGVKPLYFCHGDGYFAAASEPKALIELGLASCKIDNATVATFLRNGNYAGGESTFYSDVKRVPAASFMLVDVNSLSRTDGKYWDYPLAEAAPNFDQRQIYEKFVELFESAVQLRMRSDVPVAIALSGGLDSTAILVGASKSPGATSRCFTSTYQETGFDELSWACLASERAGADLTPCPSDVSGWLETLENCIVHLDGPVNQPAVVPVWHLMKQVRAAGIKVLLEGQGADELLGGYEQYAAEGLLSDIGRPARWGNVFASAKNGLKLVGAKTLLYSLVKSACPDAVDFYRTISGQTKMILGPVDRSSANIEVRAHQDLDVFRTGIDRRFWLDHSLLQLPRLLHYGDAISMAHGIETRMPFMDFRLVEFAFSLPATVRLDTARSKWLIRDYLVRNGQNEVGSRMDKKGYPTPCSAWLSGLAKEDLDSFFPKESPVFEYVDRFEFFKKLRGYSAVQTALTNLLFRIVSLHIWLVVRGRVNKIEVGCR